MDDEPKSQTPPPKPDGEQSPWAVAGLGMQFFVGLYVFVYVGNWMDTRWHTSPLFILAGVLLGGGGTFYLGYKRLMRDTHSESAQRGKRSPRNDGPSQS